MRPVLFGWLMAAALAPPALGHAAGEEDLAEGLRLFAALEYEEAMPRLARAKLDASLGLTARAQAAVYLAMIQLSFGDNASATRNIAEAVGFDRAVNLPAGAPPRVVSMLEEARARLAPPAALVLQHARPTPGPGPVLLAVSVDAVAGRELQRVVVYFRHAGSPHWAEGDLARVGPERFEAVLPVGAGIAVVEYYLEGRRADGTVAAQVGTSTLPLSVATLTTTPEVPATITTETEAPAFYERGWFWATTGGVVLAATAAVLYFALRDGEGPAEACGVAGEGCLEVTYHE